MWIIINLYMHISTCTVFGLLKKRQGRITFKKWRARKDKRMGEQ